jgi:hypothetical protein
MEINFEDKFQRLSSIIRTISAFSFGMKTPYVGPINPTSIISFSSNVFNVNALILAERVPILYLPFAFDSNHLEAVTVYLDDNFDFQQYQPQINELLGLSLLVGDPEYSYDGTVQGAGDFFKNKGWSLKILY